MVKTNTTILREGRQFEVDADTVTTGTLTDSDDSSAWETLREAGYETGDFVPVVGTLKSSSGPAATSNSYVDATGVMDAIVQFGTLFPSNVTIQAVMSGDYAPGSDSISARLRNLTDSETLVEATGVSSSGFRSDGPTTYSPTTTGSPVRLRFQLKNSDDSTSVTVNDANFAIGFKI